MGDVLAVVVQVLAVATALPLVWLLGRQVVSGTRILPSLATVALLLVSVADLASGAPTQAWQYVWITVWFCAFPLLLATYPDGRFVPRWLVGPVLGWSALSVANGLTRGALAEQAWWAPVIGSEILALGAQVHRYRRRSSVAERERARWPVLATLVCVAGFIALGLAAGDEVGQGSQASIALAGVLAALPAYGFAMGLVAPQRVDVDAALRAALVGVLSAGVLALGFVATTATAARLGLDAGAGAWWGAAVVACLVLPVHRGARATADRIVYTRRADTLRTLGELGARLDAGIDPLRVPSVVVQTVRDALGLAGAELRADGVLASQSGSGGAVVEVFPIDYQGETLATLAVSPRPGESGLTKHDRRVLEALARQSAAALHGTRAMAQLIDARSRIVLAREEERRRLRRDLHDDLAPTLAGLGLSATAIQGKIRAGDDDADKAVAELAIGIRGATAQVREIAYDLRPPVLDDHGLVAAIHDRLRPVEAAGLRVEVDAPPEPLVLPAAVELAALRIVQEAVANVRRHARASMCGVELALTSDALQLAVRDDGAGLPTSITQGVGLRSIHERAAELGGTARLCSDPAGGTRLQVRLPLLRQDPAEPAGATR